MKLVVAERPIVGERIIVRDARGECISHTTGVIIHSEIVRDTYGEVCFLIVSTEGGTITQHVAYPTESLYLPESVSNLQNLRLVLNLWHFADVESYAKAWEIFDGSHHMRSHPNSVPLSHSQKKVTLPKGLIVLLDNWLKRVDTPLEVQFGIHDSGGCAKTHYLAKAFSCGIVSFTYHFVD